ncbi:MAG: winged helix-turn-helix domain-containing protein [Clostridia bacterium]|nr:winged helix-turn-helix domain-containing protein [Clostridia bacterium]
MKTEKILVVTKDRYLGQKLRLELMKKAEVSIVSELPADAEEYRTVFLDADTVPATAAGAIVLSRCADVPHDLPIPLPLGLAETMIGETSEAGKLSLSDGERTVRFREKTVKLTEAEYSLLSLLIRADGQFVSREELLRGAFSEDSTGSALNVYIHYLREKLEFHGEKIILSSRKSGYAIDKKFIRMGGNGRA